MPNSATDPDNLRPTNRGILVPSRVWEDLDSFDKNVKAKFIRAFKLLSKNLNHPSLRVEIVEVKNVRVYRVRVDPVHRIHFELQGNYYAILEIGGHRLQGIG